MKHRNTFPKSHLWIAILLYSIPFSVLIALNCTERDATNPFDPHSNSQSPVVLEMKYTPENKIEVKWHWAKDPLTDYGGFRIYKATDNPDELLLYKTVPAEQFSLVDTSVQNYHWYYYRVSVFNSSTESALSNRGETYLGPGKYWVLSKLGFYIRKISYDLLNTLETYDTTFPAEDWAVSLPDSSIWLCYFRYSRGVSRLNLQKRFEDFFYTQNLNLPLSVEYYPPDKRLFILNDDAEDQEDNLLILNENVYENSISLPPDDYIKLLLDPAEENLMILGEQKCLTLSLSTLKFVDTLIFKAGYKGEDISLSQNSVQVVAASMDSGQSIIYKISGSNNRVSLLNLTGVFYRINSEGTSGNFYVAEYNPAGKDRIVKLSEGGNRLFELSGESYFNLVEAVSVNPHDQSIVVADRTGDRLYLFNSQGQLISKSKPNQFYDPIRVQIE